MKKIIVLSTLIIMSVASVFATTKTFKLVGSTNNLTWTTPDEDKVATKAYVVYDNGNSNFSIISETLKNSSQIKPIKCKYIGLNEDGYRVFECDELGTIEIKNNSLIITKTMLHLLDPTANYIFMYTEKK